MLAAITECLQATRTDPWPKGDPNPRQVHPSSPPKPFEPRKSRPCNITGNRLAPPPKACGKRPSAGGQNWIGSSRAGSSAISPALPSAPAPKSFGQAAAGRGKLRQFEVALESTIGCSAYCFCNSQHWFLFLHQGFIRRLSMPRIGDDGERRCICGRRN